MEMLITGLSKVLTWLFAIGTIGCMLVIPLTAIELVSAMLEPDTEEEMRPTRPEALAS